MRKVRLHDLPMPSLWALKRPVTFPCKSGLIYRQFEGYFYFFSLQASISMLQFFSSSSSVLSVFIGFTYKKNIQRGIFSLCSSHFPINLTRQSIDSQVWQQPSAQEAIAYRAAVSGVCRKSASGCRAGRRDSDFQQADCEECASGEGQGDGSVQRILLRWVRDDSGVRGGGQSWWSHCAGQ